MAFEGLRKRSMAFGIFAFLCLLIGCAINATGLENTDPDAASNASLPAGEFPQGPIDVDDESLASALRLYSPIVLDCWEANCGPCDLIDPKIDEMAKDLQGKVAFGKLCIDESTITRDKYDVSRTPTLLIFKNGTLVFKHIGNYPKEDLERIILTALQMR
jgi:thioredoxin 1